MAAKKASSKKNLETKIAELEAKLSKLDDQIAAPKHTETKGAWRLGVHLEIVLCIEMLSFAR